LHDQGNQKYLEVHQLGVFNATSDNFPLFGWRSTYLGAWDIN